MILYFKCPNCKSENRFKSDSETRVDLAMEHGKKLDLKCTSCEQTTSISINKVYAKESKTLTLLAGIIFLLGSLVVLYYFREMIFYHEVTMGLYRVATGLVVPAGIYFLLKETDLKRVRTFNRSFVNDQTD